MRLQYVWFMCCVCLLSGCTLDPPYTVGEACPDAQYYAKSNGTVDGSFGDAGSEYYKMYNSTHYCPQAYPICGKSKTAFICHEACRKNEIFCTEQCVKPLEDTRYCGARGLCSDSDVNSDNYHGQICSEGEICRDGLCICAKTWEIACDGKCIDPAMNDSYCGAHGLCRDSDENSHNYKGKQCLEDEICENGRCVCASSREIRCNGECIDPNRHANYCGARGLCTDADNSSVNYRGQICKTGERCEDGECKCIRSWEIICHDECIDPSVNAFYCGARGLCSDANPDSANYVGNACPDGQNCEDGVCKCAKNNEIFCNGSCTDPRNDKYYCGARGLCIADDPANADFAGGTCDRCEDGVCLCEANKHVYNNSCEPDSINHCGAHGNSCNTADYPHSTNLICQNGQCVVTACEPDAFFAADGKSCTTCNDLVKDAKVGDSIYLGHYRHLITSEEKQPIEWLVLATDDNKGVLLLSKWVLEARTYHVHYYITWKDSRMRAWLNGLDTSNITNGADYSQDNFLMAAFSDKELTCIQTVTNDNPDNPKYGTEGGEDTEDRVFLLSIDEAGYEGGGYLADDEARQAYATDYAAHATSAITYTSYYENVQYDDQTYVFYRTLWWLRTQGGVRQGAICATTIGGGGSIDLWGQHLSQYGVGVRPAMWIK